MRKVLSLILILTMVAFSGCGTQKEIAKVPETEKAKELETVVEKDVVESTIAQTVSGEAFNNSSDKELIEIEMQIKIQNQWFILQKILLQTLLSKYMRNLDGHQLEM